jgi:hypothetical protein
MSDGSFLPGSGGEFRPAETPVKHKQLVEAFERQQIAVLHYLDADGPTGSRGFGLELTSGVRWAILAARTTDSRKYRAVLVWRMIPAPRIWTPARSRYFASGRSAVGVDFLPLAPPDELQKHVEGQVIRGLLFAENPTRAGGEEVTFEFSDGSHFILAARATSRVIYHPEPNAVEHLTADIDWILTFPPDKVTL